MQYDFLELFFSKHSIYKTNALGRITHPFQISLVITSGRVKFLSPLQAIDKNVYLKISFLIFETKHYVLGKSMASDYFQDWWSEVTHGAKNGGSFSETIGPTSQAYQTKHS